MNWHTSAAVRLPEIGNCRRVDGKYTIFIYIYVHLCISIHKLIIKYVHFSSIYGHLETNTRHMFIYTYIQTYKYECIFVNIYDFMSCCTCQRVRSALVSNSHR